MYRRHREYLSVRLYFSIFACSNTNATTFTLTNSNDSGAGSLREVIFQSNAAGETNTIQFQAGCFTIVVNDSLPPIGQYSRS